MKKATRILVPLVLALFIVACIGWYLCVYDREFTRDTLLSQARFHDLHGNSKMSSWFYDMAYGFSGHDENVAIELADQYKADGNYTKAEYTLTNAISNGPTAELYTALCKTYVEQDKLMDAVNMLENVAVPAIAEELNALRPSAPTADRATGYYSQYIDVHLNSEGTIYYTLDGEYPSVAGSRYEGAITLEAGETTIYAIAVGEDGLVSPVTVLGYTVTGVIEQVTFTDPAIEGAVRELIGADADDEVYTNQLWKISEFVVPADAVSLDDLALMPYLKSLTMQDLSVTSLAPLATLAQLESLDLSGSSFPSPELSYVAALPALTRLSLSGCGISTIASLSGAPALTHLDLSSNTLRNLEVLVPMTGLVELDLKHNAVTSLSDLSSLGALEKLDISFNSVTTLEPLAACVRLTTLNADNNAISDLDGLEGLSLLTSLSLNYNDLTSVDTLAVLTGLKELSIGSNEIESISALSTLTNLEIFDFSANKVEALPAWPDGSALQKIYGSYNALSSIDSLKNMSSLTYIKMDYNLLTSVDALADNYCLVQIDVFGNDISDVSKLREHDIIVNYDPT